jgi:hypothetical protein
MKSIGLDQYHIDSFSDGSCCLKTLSNREINRTDQCDGDGYMFISFSDTRKSLGFMYYYTEYSIKWYKEQGYIYMGEFHSRKEKLKKINDSQN